jgi:methyltransferase (TIGR00027 family)
MNEVLSNILQDQFACSHSNKKLKPSTHAVAVWRAAHQLLEQQPIFEDPIALSILGEAKGDVTDKLELHKHPLSAAMRIAIAARSRFAEDERKKSLTDGTYQYVILGAGLDSYAYRNKNLNEHVFEVDLPSTQAVKIASIQRLDITPISKVSYVACDFEKNSLEERLHSSGFDRHQKTFFSWLGVVPYLDITAIEKTLKFVTSCAPGSAMVFDYIVDKDNLNEMEQFIVNILSAQLEAGGEPLKSFFNPRQLKKNLEDLGFTQIKDIGPDYLNEHYLSSREDGLRVGNVTRIFKVTV